MSQLSFDVIKRVWPKSGLTTFLKSTPVLSLHARRGLRTIPTLLHLQWTMIIENPTGKNWVCEEQTLKSPSPPSADVRAPSSVVDTDEELWLDPPLLPPPPPPSEPEQLLPIEDPPPFWRLLLRTHEIKRTDRNWKETSLAWRYT